MDYSSPYMNYEGYRGASRSSISDNSSQYPTQKAYDSVYSSFKDFFADDMLSSGPGFSFGKGSGGGKSAPSRGGRGGRNGDRRGGGWGDKDEGSGSRGKGGGRGNPGYDDLYGYDNKYDNDPLLYPKKEANPEEFLCSMCDVQCPSDESFQAHMVGQRHTANLWKLEKGGKLVKGSKKKRHEGVANVTLKSIDTVIAECNESLIGLEYVSQGPNQCGDNYLCEVCDSRMNIGNIVGHLTGGRHRENYINKEPKHAQYALEIKQYTEELKTEERVKQQERIARGSEDEETEVWPRRSLVNKKLQHFATIIQEQYGRQPTKIPFDFTAEARKQAVEQKKTTVPGVDPLPRKKKLDKDAVEKLVYEGKDPMIGLDHVTEIVKEEDPQEPNFQCEVCDKILHFGILISHLKGFKHRLNYITMFHPELKEELKKQKKLMAAKEIKEEDSPEDGAATKQKTSHERMVFLEEIAMKVESMFGRKKMKKEFIPKSDNALPRKKKLDKDAVEKLVYEGKDPMIGLDHVTEIVKEGDPQEPNFQCEVCDNILHFGILISHLKGFKHRHNYITMFHPELKEELKKQQKLMAAKEIKEEDSPEDGAATKQNTSHKRMVFLEEMAMKVESMFGRKKMKKEFIPKSDKEQSQRGGARGGGARGGGRDGGRDGGRGGGRGDGRGSGRGGARGGGRRGGHDDGFGIRSGMGRGGGRRGGRDDGFGSRLGMGRGGGRGGGRDVGRGGRRDGGRGGGPAARGPMKRRDDYGRGRQGRRQDDSGDNHERYSGTDDFYGKPPKRRAMYDIHDERDRGTFDYERPIADEGSGNTVRNILSQRLGQSSQSRSDPYADDFQTRPRQTESNLDDFLYKSKYSRRPDMDMSSILSKPKQSDTDAYILAEFEKRFGKRIKLGGDSDTLVLGNNGNSGQGQRGGASSYDSGATSYGQGATSYGSGAISYGGGTTSYGGDTGAYDSSPALQGSSSYGSSDRYESSLMRTGSSTTYNEPSYLGPKASGSLSYTGRGGGRDLGR